jgi:hypothetical protein
MTDRELLEWAAKAAGIQFQWDTWANAPLIVNEEGIDTRTWNPLNDDGDTLRLAMKLHISPTFLGCATEGEGWAEARYLKDRYTVNPSYIQVPYIPEEMFNNPRDVKYAEYLLENYGYVRGFEAATRRAVTLAAAELGKAKV